MRAMVLEKQGMPLVLKELPKPVPGNGEVLLHVHACGVCRTDLHVVDGDLKEPKLPLILGHQIVGTVEALGPGSSNLYIGERIGVPWLGKCCLHCRYCAGGKENLCNDARYTGYQQDGGFADFCVADAQFCFPIPQEFSHIEAAPLLCAGLIGYRSYRMTGNPQRIGFYGFGSSAHILIQLALFEGKEVYVFTRKGDREAQDFAAKLGAAWVGDAEEKPPAVLDAAIIFAPVGPLVPAALRVVDKGGVVVCAGIHMSDIPSFPYALLWEERMVRSVANLTRRDGIEFLNLAPKVPIKTEVTTYPLEEANDALNDLREGRLSGSAVITL